MKFKIYYISIVIFLVSCAGKNGNKQVEVAQTLDSVQYEKKIEKGLALPGIHSFGDFLPLIENKSVAIVANHTSSIEGKHLVDTLRSSGITVRKVYAPEHGFRGAKDAGENIEDQHDDSGLEIISLYGKNKKPSAESLTDVDVVIFDIQDVGVRFFTYLSTLHYVMEACAENDKKLIVLDRPNPNGFYIDGPVLKTNERSFIGLHPVPIVYGLTIGEYAQMINGEQYLANQVQCNLTVIPCKNYTHKTVYNLPTAPSPNLPNMRSVYLYPSLALFEGTVVSVGRGTDAPFQMMGHPDYTKGDFSYTPKPSYGAKYPKLENKLCHGVDFRKIPVDSFRLDSLNLTYLIDMYSSLPNKKTFFLKNNFFNKLAGNSLLMVQIKKKMPASEIKKSWETDLNIYMRKRLKYLIYED